MKSLVSTIRSVVQVVDDFETAAQFYEDGLDLENAEQEGLDDFYGAELQGNRIARFERPGEPFGCIELVENPNANEPIRNDSRPFDFGILTLNFRTSDIDRAVRQLEDHGAEPISEILSYNVGKPMRELMMTAPTGDRLTILEVGGKVADQPLFSEAIATVGMVVPSMAESRRFYEELMELETAVAFEAKGSPFDTLLGVTQLNRLDFATLTADGNWTGKVELLELDIGGESGEQRVANGSSTGYWMFSMLTEDLTEVAERTGAQIQEINRPFFGRCRVVLLKASGGEIIEVIESQEPLK